MLPLPQNFHSICRTCLSNGNLLSLFTDSSKFSLHLSKMLMECAPVTVDENDFYPSKICVNCVDQLHTAYLFRQKCLGSDRILKSIDVLDVKIEIEKHQISDTPSRCIILKNALAKDKSETNTENQSSTPIKIEVDNEENNVDSCQYEESESDDTEKQQLPIQYNCKKCDEIFTSLVKFTDHKKKIHGNKHRHLCNVCGKTFARPSMLKRHMNSQVHASVWKCSKCQTIFPRESALKEHLAAKHPPECDICNKNFASRLHLRRHIMRIHEPQHSCNVCSVSFNTEAKLKNHKIIHDDHKIRICDLCGQKVSANNVQRHRQTHTGLRRHMCDICGMGFIQKPTLKEHRAKHSLGETPYNCVRCKISFPDVDFLKQHMDSHPKYRRGPLSIPKTGDKQFVCKYCDKKYKSYVGVQYHMRAAHTNERPYLCNMCGKSFTQEQQLQCHMHIHTGEKPYKCEYCEKRFVQRAHVQSHMRLHTGEKPYECPFCHKAFRHLTTLRDHKKIHTGETNTKKRRYRHPRIK